MRWPSCTAPEPRRIVRGRGGDEGDDDGRRGAGDAGVEVVLGEPVAAVAEPLGLPGEVDACCAAPAAASEPERDRDEVEDARGMPAMVGAALSGRWARGRCGHGYRPRAEFGSGDDRTPGKRRVGEVPSRDEHGVQTAPHLVGAPVRLKGGNRSATTQGAGHPLQIDVGPGVQADTARATRTRQRDEHGLGTTSSPPLLRSLGLLVPGPAVLGRGTPMSSQARRSRTGGGGRAYCGFMKPSGLPWEG